MKTLILSILIVASSGTLLNAQNLIARYNFENDILDISGNAHHLETKNTGTPYNFETSAAMGTHCVHFQYGQGLESINLIDGSSWNAMAVSFWIKDSVNSSTFGSIVLYSGLGTYLTESIGSIHTAFDGSYAGGLDSPNALLNDGQWHHVVVQNTSANSSIYIDGTLVVTQVEALVTGNSSILIGAFHTDDSAHKGDFYLDDLRLYDDTLTPNQIDDLAAGSLGVIDYSDLRSTINVHPNPVISQLTITTEDEVESIVIYNIFGEIVQWESTTSFSVENLPSGIYIIQMKTAKGLIGKRFVKE